MRRRHELTDEQWEWLKDHLPGKVTDPGRSAVDNRLFVYAALYVLNTGIPWADLPQRFGKPNTVWKRYDRWAEAGVWERVARELGDVALSESVEELLLDSTSVKAHPTASTGRREPGEKHDADALRGRRCLSRSRGPRKGLTTKSRAAVDQDGRLRRLMVTPGQRDAAPQAPVLMGGLKPTYVLADAAYDSDAIRSHVAASGGRACAKPNSTLKRRKRYDPQRYLHRNVSERFFRRIKQCRRVATRYETKAINFAAFGWLAAGIAGMTFMYVLFSGRTASTPCWACRSGRAGLPKRCRS